MRILLVVSHFHPAHSWGGPVKSTWNLVRGIAGQGIDVAVVTTNAEQKGVVQVQAWRTEQGVRVFAAPVIGGGRISAANRYAIAPTVLRVAFNEVSAADIVYLNGAWGVPVMAAYAACRWTKTPYVLAPRGTLEIESLRRRRLKKSIGRRCFAEKMVAGSAALHFATEMERENSSDWVKNHKSFVVPNPVEVTQQVDGCALRKRLTLGTSNLVLGMFGRVHQQKGFDKILPAIHGARNRHLIRLVVVGPDEAGTRRKVEADAERLGLRDNIIWVGNKTAEQLPEYYAMVDALVLPSYHESFGNVAVESLIQGTPILISDKVGLKDWVEKNGVGEVVPLDAESWSRAIERLEPEKLQRKENADFLRRKAIEDFTVDAVAKKMIAEIAKILGENTR